jgi:hypothetical protein
MPVTFPERLKELCEEKRITAPSWVERSKYGSVVAKEYFSLPNALLLPKKRYSEKGHIMDIMQYPDSFLPTLDRLINFLLEKRPDKPKKKKITYQPKPIRSYRPVIKD